MMSFFNIAWKAFLIVRARIMRGPVLAVALIGLSGIIGCTTPSYQDPSMGGATQKPEPVLLREGDVVAITFPGAPNLNGPPQQIRRDGKITLPSIGEVTAAGKTVERLQQTLITLYSGQLVMKEINVTVESSIFSVYVTGSVLKPGRIDANRPITALEAIMEAGGFDYNRSNMKEVTVTRTTKGHVEHFSLNLKRVLEGKDSGTFYLKPSDIVFVPERFTWF
jgi:polysaccharide export outer membrane protein